MKYDCIRVSLFVIFTHHTCLNTTPQSQQNDCSFAAPSPSSSSSGTDIEEWWWVFCCATEILSQCVLQMYTFFFPFFFGGSLLVDLFVLALPVFCLKGKSCKLREKISVGEVLYFYEKPLIKILQNKLNQFQFRFHFYTHKWNWVSKKINYSFSFDFNFWKLKFGFGLVLSNSYWNQMVNC